jgi:glycosyltransferase involved in cell wall biosynthesis
MNIKVSVALCTYNAIKFLEAQLNSIVNQSHQPDEIIIVDDKSDDSTIDFLNQFKLQNKLNIKLYSNEFNLGVIKNYEKAIELCSGDVIFLSDQDDVWNKNKISSHLAIYKAYPDCGYIFSDAELVDENNKSLGKSLWSTVGFTRKRLREYNHKNQLKAMVTGGNFIYGNTMSFNARYKSILLPIDFTSSTHDVWISMYLAAIDVGGIAINKPLIKYRQHSTQVAGAFKKKFILKLLEVLKSEYINFEKKSEDIKQLLMKVQSCGINHNYEIFLLKEFQNHMNNRSKIQTSSLLSSIYLIKFEFLNNRYSIYSRSILSAFKDLLNRLIKFLF